jgi:hypothetical protein
MRYDHKCALCSKAFKVHDVRYFVKVSLVAACFTALGALVILFPPGAAVGAEHSNRWFGIGFAALGAVLWLLVIYRIQVRSAHPVVSV